MYLAAMSTTPSDMPINSSQRLIAKVLRPEDAVASVDGQPLQSTLYRYNTLLVFSKDWEGDFDAFVETTLQGLGLDVRVEEPRHLAMSMPCFERSAPRPRASADLGVPLVLHLQPRNEEPPLAPVDSWRALQNVRFAAARNRPEFLERAQRMSLEHILWSATSADGGESGGSLGWEGHGDDGDGDGGPGRIPVAVLAAAPPRTLDETFLGRRPVVAILDTPIGPHDWLPKRWPDDKDWVVEEKVWGNKGIDLSNPLVGRLDSHLGHGTFIAGIIRQIAPEASVLSIPVMHSDGCVLESALTSALSDLCHQVTNNGLVVDVLVLALGYYPETPTQPDSSPILPFLQELAAAGIRIVAAAGNDATARECYPAAYTTRPWAHCRVHAVGALNPNTTRAIFSNDDPFPSEGEAWVSDWEPGVAIVSTFPKVDGSLSPALSKVALNRQSYDRDAFSTGFALWQGTSFAAAVYAAKCALQATPPQPQQQS
jgi:hypothetical protein